MFKLGKKREASEQSLNSRLTNRIANQPDSSTIGGGSPYSRSSTLTPGSSSSTMTPSSSDDHIPRSANMVSMDGSPTPASRPRSGSIFDKMRPKSFATSSDAPPTPKKQPDAPYLTVGGAGGTGLIGEGSLSLDGHDFGFPNGGPVDRRASNASQTSNNGMAAPALTLQRSSPVGSPIKLPTEAAGSGEVESEGWSRERSRSNDRTPRADRHSTMQDPNAFVVQQATYLDLGGGGEAPMESPDPISINGYGHTNGDVATGRGLPRAPSDSRMRSETAPPSARKMTVSSIDSASSSPANFKSAPPASAKTNGSKEKKGKSRAGSASSGIAGALALSGVALASPSPGLSQPKVLRNRVSSANMGAVNGVGNGGRRESKDDDASIARPKSLDMSSDQGHEAYNEGLVPPPENLDYDAMMSMESLGNFDDVMSQLGTGYAVASSKRNNDFHALFGGIPEDDYLIEDYGCALQKDILVQGRLYVSEHHLCFNANIFGWVTSLVIPFSDVVTIEKRMTALIIPNAIQMATMHARYTFASFLSRDSTYDLITNIWRISHPTVPSIFPTNEGDLSADPHAEKEDLEDKKKKNKSPKKKNKAGGTVVPDLPSSSPTEATTNTTSNGTSAVAEEASPAKKPAAAVALHPATKCVCDGTDEHYKNVAMDTVFPTTPEKIYNLLYTSGFTKTFWAEDQKLTDIQFGDWEPGPSGNQLLKRSGTYVMALTAAMGPKSTRCHITDENRHVDFDKYITNITTTKTPDVPSGGNFATVTRTCITWAPKNQCRMLVTTQVEWTKVNRFIRGIVDSSAVSGQVRYHTALEAAVRAYIKQHRTEFQDEAVEDAASEDVPLSATEPEAASSPAERGSSSVAVSSTKAAGVAKTSHSDKILDGASDIVGGIIDFLSDQSPTMLGAAAFVVVLLLFNFWTLKSRYSAPSHSTTTTTTAQYTAGTHEVAHAVRDVLDQWFSSRGLQHAMGPGHGVGNVAPSVPVPVLSTREEVEDIGRLLDVLDGRIQAVREALRMAVSEMAARDSGVGAA